MATSTVLPTYSTNVLVVNKTAAAIDATAATPLFTGSPSTVEVPAGGQVWVGVEGQRPDYFAQPAKGGFDFNGNPNGWGKTVQSLQSTTAITVATSGTTATIQADGSVYVTV